MKKQLAHPYIFCFIILFCVLSEAMAANKTAALSETQAKEQYERAKTLIHTYSGEGDHYQQAVALADNIRRSSPQSPYSYLIIAELKARQHKDNRQGDPSEIWALTDKVLSLDPKIADAYVIRSKISLIQGDSQRAQSEADQAIKLDSRNKEAMFAKAQAEETSSHFPQAEGWYLKAIEAHSDPDRKSNIYYWLAQMYLNMTPPQISKADQSMAKCANLSPRAPWKLVNYAIFLNTSAGNYEKAAEYAQRALAIMDFPMGHLQLGMARYGMWAAAFSKTSDHSPEQRAKAKNDVEAIIRDTGITPAEAVQYASQYMRQSKIQNSITSAGLLQR